jgi:Cupin-like domain
MHARHDAEPFVGAFTTAAQAWSAIQAEHDREVPVQLWRRAALCGIGNLTREVRARARLGDVLDHVANRSQMFDDAADDEDVSIWALAQEIAPAVLSLVPIPPELPGPHVSYIWFGGRGQRTTLHEDEAPNYNFQLHGCKRFIVFRPDDAVHLDRDPDRVGEFRADPGAAGGLADPALAKTRPRIFTLAPGQFIHIPPWWPHQVTYLSRSAANVNHWGRSQPRIADSNEYAKEETRSHQGNRQEPHPR